MFFSAQTFFILFFLQHSGNIRPFQSFLVKLLFQFAPKQPNKSVLFWIKKQNIIYPKKRYQSYPKIICAIFLLFLLIYGFTHFSLHPFFVSLWIVLSICYPNITIELISITILNYVHTADTIQKKKIFFNTTVE